MQNKSETQVVGNEDKATTTQTTTHTTSETAIVIEGEGAANVNPKYLPMTDLNNQSKVVDEVTIW